MQAAYLGRLHHSHVLSSIHPGQYAGEEVVMRSLVRIKDCHDLQIWRAGISS